MDVLFGELRWNIFLFSIYIIFGFCWNMKPHILLLFVLKCIDHYAVKFMLCFWWIKTLHFWSLFIFHRKQGELHVISKPTKNELKVICSCPYNTKLFHKMCPLHIPHLPSWLIYWLFDNCLMSARKKKLACRHCHEGLQNLCLYLVLMVFEQKCVFSAVT